MMCIWCAKHHVNLVVKIANSAYAETAHSFTVQLRAQANLEMNSKCPKDTQHLAHFQNKLQWLIDHRIYLFQ